MTFRSYTLAVVFLFASCPTAFAQTRDDSGGQTASASIVQLSRLRGDVIIDGSPDEDVWRSILPLPLTVVRPVFEATASQRTEIRVAFDDEYLYASGKFYEDDASLIRMNSLQRDIWSGDDAFQIHLDTFNDNENSFRFWVTPAGTKGESAVTNDGEGNAVNGSWNTYWDAATTRTSEGWFVEIRIPLTNLQFQPVDGRATIGLTTGRLIARTNELIIYPSIAPRWKHYKPSQAQDVSFEMSENRKLTHFTPFVSSGYNTAKALSTDQSKYRTLTDQTQDIGLDVKFNLTRNLTLDLTANTDFAQVEADDQKINFTQFSLFFPEKRQFFQERAGIFNFRMARGSRLFHGRRIGLDSGGTPVPIVAGAKLVGRVSDWDVGAFNVQTARSGAIGPENFSVLRLRRKIFNQFSTLGVLATTRIGTGGVYNAGYGFDGIFRVVGNDYLTLKWSQTRDQESDGFSLDVSQSYFHWQRRSITGLNYFLEIGRVGTAYNPGIGFVNQRDITVGTSVIAYNILTDDHAWLQSYQPSIVAIRKYRNDTGELERNYIGPWVEFTTKRGDYGWIEPRFYFYDQQTGFSLSDEVDIEAGRYTWSDLQLFYQMSTGRRLRIDFNVEIGGFYDGKMRKALVGPTWNASRFLEIGGEYEFTDLDFKKRDLSLQTHLLRMKFRLAANTRMSVSAFLQYNSLAEVVEGNVRFRYNFKDGQDLWLVYNEGLNTKRVRHGIEPDLPISNGRTLIFKYTHTLSI